MKDKLDKLIHKVVLKGDPKYRDLSLKDKVKLMDEFLDPSSHKALIVDFDFSHTGRKINRRFYSKVGHIQTAQDLIAPYFKPITLNHEMDAETIIGRIVKADFISIIDEAASHFSHRNLSPNGLSDFDRALYNLDFEKIRDFVKKYSLDKDKKWPGIGKIAASAKITDKDAIERFIDGRFQTFSAETDSDVRVCSECLVDWMKDGPCDHYWEDSTFCMTGNMIGGGSSVVTHPADDLSLVTSMRFSDSKDKLEINSSLDDIMFTDSHQQLVVVDDSEILMNELIKKFALDQELTAEEKDKLYEDVFNLEEIKTLTIIEDGKEIKLIDNKLTKKQRTALPSSAFIGSHKSFPGLDAVHITIAKIILDKAIDILKTEESSETLNDKVKSIVDRRLAAFGCNKTEQEVVEDKTIIQEQKDMISKMFSIENLKNLSKEDFKDKVLKVVNEVAEELEISNFAQSEELTKILADNQDLQSKLDDKIALVDEITKQKSLIDERYKAIKIEYKELFGDHSNLFNELDTKNELMDNLIEKLVPILKVLKPSCDENDKTLKNIHLVLDSVELSSLESKLNDGLSRQQVSEIENPLNASSENESNKPNIDSLTSYEKNVIEKYKSIIKSISKDEADKWFSNKIKVYCNKDFHPSKFVE